MWKCLAFHGRSGGVQLVLDHELEGGVAYALQLLLSFIAVQIQGHMTAACLVPIWEAQKLPAMQAPVECLAEEPCESVMHHRCTAAQQVGVVSLPSNSTTA